MLTAELGEDVQQRSQSLGARPRIVGGLAGSIKAATPPVASPSSSTLNSQAIGLSRTSDSGVETHSQRTSAAAASLPEDLPAVGSSK